MWFGITRCNTKFGHCGTESECWPLSHVPPHCGKPCPTQNPSVPLAFFSTLLRLPPSFTRIPQLWDEGSVCHKQTTSHQSKRLPSPASTFAVSYALNILPNQNQTPDPFAFMFGRHGKNEPFSAKFSKVSHAHRLPESPPKSNPQLQYKKTAPPIMCPTIILTAVKKVLIGKG